MKKNKTNKPKKTNKLHNLLFLYVAAGEGHLYKVQIYFYFLNTEDTNWKMHFTFCF